MNRIIFISANENEYYKDTKKGPSSHIRDHDDKNEIRSIIQGSSD